MTSPPENGDQGRRTVQVPVQVDAALLHGSKQRTNPPSPGSVQASW